MADSGVYTEDTLARRRLAMAQALLGDRKQPIRHWAEGLDELAKGAFGGYQFGKIEREEQNSKESDRKAMADLLGMPYVPKTQSRTGYDTISSLLSGGEQTPIAPLPPPAQMQAPVPPQTLPPQAPQAPQQQGQLPVEDGGFNRMDARAGDPQIQQALLGAIAGAESPNYTTKFGGGQFNSFADHPRDPVPITSGPMAGQRSTAAGKYQFLSPTWDAKAKELGLSDFSPQNQDTAAWDLANQTYKKKTGGDLETDVKAGKVQQIAAALSGIWPSLPGGGQPNPATQGFGGRLASGMQDQAQIPPNAAPVQGMQQPQAAMPPPGVPTQQQAAPAGDRAPLNIPPNVAAFIQQAMASNNPQMRAQAIALYQQYSSPEEYGFQTLPDGTIVKTSKKTGNIEPAYKAESKPTWGVIEEGSDGVKKYGWIDPYKQSVTPVNPSGGGGAPRTVTGPGGKEIPIPPGVNEKEFIKQVTQGTADAAVGKQTEVQSNATQFANRMEDAEKNLNKFQKEGTSVGGALLDKIPLAGNMMQSKGYQDYKQAQRQFITALLRKESGAAINQGEFDNYEKQFFPQPGDGPDVIGQKQQARAVAIDAMKKAAGPAYTSPAGGAAPMPQVGAVMQGYKFKGGDPKDKNNWEQVQ